MQTMNERLEGELEMSSSLGRPTEGLGLYCCMNTTTKKQGGEERLGLAHTSVWLFI